MLHDPTERSSSFFLWMFVLTEEVTALAAKLSSPGCLGATWQFLSGNQFATCGGGKKTKKPVCAIYMTVIFMLFVNATSANRARCGSHCYGVLEGHPKLDCFVICFGYLLKRNRFRELCTFALCVMNADKMATASCILLKGP